MNFISVQPMPTAYVCDARHQRNASTAEQKGGPHQQIARVEGDRLWLPPLAVDELGRVYLLTHGG